MTKRPRRLEECPNCGAPFRRGRLACPECGSDARTGWQAADEIEYQSIDIPDSYEELVGDKPKTGFRWPTWFILVVAACALAFFLRLY